MARRRLLAYPDYQAEAIAKHYTALAMTALQLLKLVEHRRQVGVNSTIDHCIQMLVEEIKTNHWHDFGIKLEWQQPDPQKEA